MLVACATDARASAVGGELVTRQFFVQGATTQPRLAFVIGISDYDGDGVVTVGNDVPPLRSAHSLTDLVNPVRDARAIAAKLRKLGYFVYLSENPDKSRLMEEAAYFRKVVRRAGPRAISFTYFAGHGISVNGSNYVLPAKAVLPLQGLPESSTDLDARVTEAAIGLKDLLFASGETTNDAAHLLILDACRNNPWERLIDLLGYAKSVGLVDQAISVPRTMIVFSTAPGEFSYDGEGQNSPFASALLDSLSLAGTNAFIDFADKTGIERNDANRVAAIRVAMRKVAKDSDGDQVPYMNGPIVDEVCLSACRLLTLQQAKTILAHGGFVTNDRGFDDGADTEKMMAYKFAGEKEQAPDTELLWMSSDLPAWATGFASEIPLPR